ncbi:MAG: hypothetical protein Q4P24_14685 [Rhodobacterales bacterium]|nr:hypothetical protein [Rhodobacterales bacterium]
MGKVHIKGRILQLLARSENLWDYDICDVIMKEYGLHGRYWIGTVRMTLTDLHSGGLIDYLESKIEPGGGERLLNCYRLNEFGRSRLRQTGLVEEMI